MTKEFIGQLAKNEQSIEKSEGNMIGQAIKEQISEDNEGYQSGQAIKEQSEDKEEYKENMITNPIDIIIPSNDVDKKVGESNKENDSDSDNYVEQVNF